MGGLGASWFKTKIISRFDFEKEVEYLRIMSLIIAWLVNLLIIIL